MLAEHPQCIARNTRIPWHAHRGGYAAIVLGGSYIEAGDGGRRRVEPGDVVIHKPFSAHEDRVSHRDVEVVNLPLPVSGALSLESGKIGDPEGLLRDIGDDRSAIVPLLARRIERTAGEEDLADLLAATLDQAQQMSLAEWADGQGVSSRTVTRHFTALYGIAPAHYRMRSRTLAAWRDIVRNTGSLAHVAHDRGFADQAHMSRAVRALTGHSPSIWRRFSRCLSD